MKLLNGILRKCTGEYKFHKSQEKFNHFVCMDNTKVFAKNENVENLI